MGDTVLYEYSKYHVDLHQINTALLVVIWHYCYLIGTLKESPRDVFINQITPTNCSIMRPTRSWLRVLESALWIYETESYCVTLCIQFFEVKDFQMPVLLNVNRCEHIYFCLSIEKILPKKVISVYVY